MLSSFMGALNPLSSVCIEILAMGRANLGLLDGMPGVMTKPL